MVVENVERNIEEGLTPLAAAHQAMKEVSGPIVAIGLVLCAVFVPMAFLDGVTGQFYRQFAVTIAISTVISTINSLTLSPALAAMLLKPHDAPKDRLKAKAQADPTVLSSAQAMAGLTALGEEVLPPGMDFEWTDLSYQQATQGNAALVVFPLSILPVSYTHLTLPTICSV